MNLSLDDITTAFRAAAAKWNDSRFTVVELTQEMIDADAFRTVGSIEYFEKDLYIEPNAYEPEKGTINLQGRVSPDQLPGYMPIRRARMPGYIIGGKLYTKTYSL